MSKNDDFTCTTFNVGVSDRKDRTTFLPATVFGKHGGVVAKYVAIGRQVLVDGRITVSQKRRFSIVANNVRFVGETTTKKESDSTPFR